MRWEHNAVVSKSCAVCGALSLVCGKPYRKYPYHGSVKPNRRRTIGATVMADMRRGGFAVAERATVLSTVATAAVRVLAGLVVTVVAEVGVEAEIPCGCADGLPSILSVDRLESG